MPNVWLFLALSFITIYPGKVSAADPGCTRVKQSWNEIKETESEQLHSMVNHARHLSLDLGDLDIRISTVKEDLHIAAQYLAIPGIIAKDLKRLETVLNSLSELTKTAQVVPQIRQKAEALHAKIEPFHQKVKTAREKADKVAEKVEPVRKTVVKAEKAAGVLYDGLERFRKPLYDDVSRAAVNVQKCINLASSPKKECLQKNADAVAKIADNALKEMDRVVLLLLTDFEGKLPGLAEIRAFNAAMVAVSELRDRIDALYNSLEGLESPLDDLDHLLGKKYGFRFPYPDICHKTVLGVKTPYPCVSHYTVSVSMKIIVQGADAIEKEIESILSSALWTALKAVGVDKAVKAIQKQGEQALNPILDRMHFDIKLEIPGLDNLAGLENIADKLINGLPANFALPAFNATTPSFGLPQVKAGIDFTTIYKELPKLKSPKYAWDCLEGCQALELCK